MPPSILRLLTAGSILLAAGCTASGTGVDPDTPASVAVTPAALTLTFLGDTATLGANVSSSSGAALSSTVTWGAAPAGIVSVGASGLVTALAVGTATVSGTAGGVSDQVVVTVQQDPAAIAKTAGDAQTGSTGHRVPDTLRVTVTDAGGSPVPGVALVWAVTAGGGALDTTQVTADAGGSAYAVWRLGHSAGEQSVGVTAGNADATFTATAEQPAADTLALTPALDTIRFPGDTLRFFATVYAADDSVIPMADVDWASADTTLASVDSTGLVTGKAEGTTQILASSGAVADTSTVVVVNVPPPLIDSVAPAVLIVGTTATVYGQSFQPAAADNVVLLGEDTVALQSASATQLQFVVPALCRPARTDSLSVTTVGGRGKKTVQTGPDSAISLSAGQGWVVYGGEDCVQLDAGPTNAEYLIGILSSSSAPSSLTPAALFSEAGDSTVPAPVAPRMVVDRRGASSAFTLGGAPTMARAPARSASASVRFGGLASGARDGSREAELRDSEERLMRELGPASRWGAPLRGPAAIADSLPAVGDTLDVLGGYPTSCSTRDSVRAVTRLVGADAIWLWDVANPGPEFTAAELSTLDSLYSATTAATLNDYFGDFFDLDGNGRIFVLMTRDVNEQDLGGFVWSGDLYASGVCATSNEAEIFYGMVPDSLGVAGDVQTRADVLAFYPSLIAHETTHIIQRTQEQYYGGAPKTRWEIEGGATLAESLVGFQVLGHASGQDLGWSEMFAGQDWYRDWMFDAAAYFGWDEANGRIANAPEACTWIGRVADGNAGPCKSSRAVYGVPSLLLRYMLDRFGPAFPGGEEALMRQITASDSTGYGTLREVSGEALEATLASFFVALWADGRDWNAITSWDLFDIFTELENQPSYANVGLVPYTTTATAPQLPGSVSVRGGSSAFLRWMPPSSTQPVSLRLRTPDDQDAPANLALWIYRLR